MAVNYESPSVLVVAAIIAVLSNRSPAAEDPAASLAASAAREYDILAASLRVAAEEYLAEVADADQTGSGDPEINWRLELRKPREYVAPDGSHVSVNTERVYRVSVARHERTFRLQRINSIRRTGVRSFPFVGNFCMQIQTKAKMAQTVLTEPNVIPDGYRPLKPSESGADTEQEAAGADGNYPRSIPARNDYRTDEAPKPIQDAMATLVTLADQAEPTVQQTFQDVELHFSLKAGKWLRRPPVDCPIALGGCCPVTLRESHREVPGDVRFGIIHQGELYLFADQQARQKFLSDPEKYAQPPDDAPPATSQREVPTSSPDRPTSEWK